MAREILYSSLDFRVTREEGVIAVEQRNRGAIVFGAAACLLGLLGWWARSLLPSANAYAMLLHWFCIIMLATGVLLLLGAAYFTLRKRGHRFDPHHGIATLQGRDYLMRELQPPALTAVTVGSTQVHTLVIRHAGQEIALMSSTAEGALDPVHQALSEAFSANSPLRVDQVNETARGSVTWRRFLAAFLLLLGVLWSGVGYLTLPDVLLAPRGHDGGVLMWPLGLWLMALGLLEWAYCARGRSFFDGDPRLVRIALAAWLISYFLVCWR